MKKLVASLVAASFLVTSVARADIDIPVPATPFGEVSVGPAVSPMKKGQVAPFTGVLLSPEAVAKIIVDYNNQKNQTQIEVDRARELQKAEDRLVVDNLAADLKREKDVATAQVQSRDDQLKILTQRLEQSEKDKPNVPLVAGLGVLGGAAIVVLSIVAVGAASK